MPQNEVDWVLDTIQSNWPDAMFPSDLARINRDRPEILGSGRRTKDVELTQHNAVAAELGDRRTEPYGTQFWYDVETVVDVRVHAAHDSIYGYAADDDGFRQLVHKIQRAIDDARCCPSVDDDGDTVGTIAYFRAIRQNESANLAPDRDYYRTDFEVVLRGIQER